MTNIFHSAATVRFDEEIETSARINLGGTVQILMLAKRCENLRSYVHISTAYAYVSKHGSLDIEERFYRHDYDYNDLLESIGKQKMSEPDRKELNKW